MDLSFCADRIANNEERWTALGYSESRLILTDLRGAGQASFGSSQHAVRGKMKKENIVTRKWGDRRKGNTDWASR